MITHSEDGWRDESDEGPCHTLLSKGGYEVFKDKAEDDYSVYNLKKGLTCLQTPDINQAKAYVEERIKK